MNGPHHGLKIYTSPKRGRTPPWVRNSQVHEVNGPHHGLKIYTSPKSGRTPPWVKNSQVHEVNGPYHGLKIYTSSRSKRTQPGPNLYKSKKWTDQTVRRIIQVRHVGSHQGSRPLLTEKTDPTGVAKNMKDYDVDGSN